MGLLFVTGVAQAVRASSGFPTIVDDLLLIAAKSGKYERVVELVQPEEGANPDVQDANGCTPLHLAIMWESDIEEVTLLKIVNYLLSNNVDLDKQTNYGDTLLHIASSHPRNLRIVEALLKKKADPDKQNKNGMTPLHFAVEGGLVDIAKTLIEAGASMNIEDNLGRKPDDTEPLDPHFAAWTDEIKGFINNKRKGIACVLACHPRLDEFSPLRVLPNGAFP